MVYLDLTRLWSEFCLCSHPMAHSGCWQLSAWGPCLLAACWLAAASVPCLMNLPIQPFISSKSVAVSRMSEVKVAQLCPTLCDPIGYTVHGILQARILEWVAIPFSGVSSLPRDWTQASCIAGGFFTNWAIRKAPLEWVCVTKVNLHLLTCYAKKPIYWHQFVGKGSTEFISCSKDPNSLMVSGKLFFLTF